MSTFCLEISMLIQAGITVRNGILMMLDDEHDSTRHKINKENKHYNNKIILQNIHDNLENGSPLSNAMRNGGYFPIYMTNIIEIGEKTGRLPQALKALSEHYERRERLLISIRNATLYPAILLALMMAVVLILIVQVLPIFYDVFGRMGTQMSPFAMQLMQFGAWLGGASVTIVLILCIIFAVAFLVWATPKIQENVIRLFRNKWGGSGIVGRVASFQFVSSMALAISSGLDIEEAIILSASLNSSSQVLNNKYEKCMFLIRTGSNLANALREAEIISARDGRMLLIGDQSGMADSAMAEIARRNDQSIQDEISNIVSKIEPTLVIITSAIVGIILLSVMLPLMGIMTSIG